MRLEFIKNDELIATHIDKIEDFRNLPILEVAETSYLNAPEVLDFVNLNEMPNFVKTYVSKIAHGGIITLGGTNLGAVASGFYHGMISPFELSVLLFGKCNEPWAFKSGCYNPEDIKTIMESLGLKITTVMIENYKFAIQGSRI